MAKSKIKQYREFLKENIAAGWKLISIYEGHLKYDDIARIRNQMVGTEQALEKLNELYHEPTKSQKTKN